MNHFDVVVLTAANEAQAIGYREQLAWRKEVGVIPEEMQCHVITDPGGRRVGSLGATIHVLHVLRKQSDDFTFSEKQILICHSGGDSRRTPAYAAQGKVFTPLPLSGNGENPLALFDLILQSVEKIPTPESGQVLICAGDVLLTFDTEGINFSEADLSGVGYPDSLWQGARHGVYLPETLEFPQHGPLLADVKDFLQKPSETEARNAGAIGARDRVIVDTGLLSLSPKLCDALLAFGEAGTLDALQTGACPSLDLYDVLTMALSPHCDEATFLRRVKAETGGANHLQRLREFRAAMRPFRFSVNVIPRCDFFHIGSSNELLTGLSSPSRTAETYGFKNGCGAQIDPTCLSGESAFIFQSILTQPVHANHALLESVALEEGPGIALAGKNILTGIPAAALREGLELPESTGMVALPIRDTEWITVVYGLNDDFKSPFGGDRCTFLNQPLDAWIRHVGAKPEELWKNDEKDGLWSARLWVPGTIEESVHHAKAILAGKWKFTETRLSMKELIPLVNHRRLLAERRELNRRTRLLQIGARIAAHTALRHQEVTQDIQTEEDRQLALQHLAMDLQRETDPLVQARMARMIAHITTDTEEAEQRQKEALEAVSRAVSQQFRFAETPTAAKIKQDQVVWVTSPIRIDFAGGWSDTPPICTERGGRVLNAAVKLNGLYPIQVMAKLNQRGCIHLTSIDLGKSVDLFHTEEILDQAKTGDWASLAKAALRVAGIAPTNPAHKLSTWLETLGGGLDLTIFSSLPKGSGLGTSSILGASVLACLDRVLGHAFQPDRLTTLTSILEQTMRTGGGWQDQIGGMLPGVKLIVTEPGVEQTAFLRWCAFNFEPSSEFWRRSLLYYTGQRRMACNILHQVVNRYLDGDPQTLATVHALKEGTSRMKEILDRQDINGFCQELATYWELKKAIDPGTTNSQIEALLKKLDPFLSAALLPGAGGGGFLFMVAKDEKSVAAIRETLEREPMNEQARFFDFEIDQKGMSVAVL